MKERIKKLRAEGLTYKEISVKVGCSKGTVAYHCGTGQKEKANKRRRKNRNKNPIKTKLERLKGRPIKTKIRDFQRNRENSGTFKKGVEKNFTIKDFIDKCYSNPVCYISGRKIDLFDTSSYNLDHIIPVSKGGGNGIDNLGLACKEANKGKDDLYLEDFISLCKDILEHNGYSINANRK